MGNDLLKAIEDSLLRHGAAELPLSLGENGDPAAYADVEGSDEYAASQLRAAHDLLDRSEEFVVPHLAEYASDHARVLDRWGTAIAWLELFRLMCAAVVRDYEDRAGQDVDLNPREANRHLFWSGFQIGGEVLVLLRSGYPAGALARSRAIYENALRAGVIGLDANELSVRYLEHEEMRERLEDQRLQGWTKVAFTKEHMRENARLNEELVAKYGRVFGGDYGWAHEALLDDPEYAEKSRQGRRLRGPTVDDLRAQVGIRSDHTANAFIYSRANAAVHGAARSHRLAFDDDGAPVLPDGPTSEGLWLAGRQTVFSLRQLADAYMVQLTEELDARLDLLDDLLRTVSVEIDLLLLEIEAGNDVELDED